MSNFLAAALGLNRKPTVAGFRVQTSVYGIPIPIVYGQARIAGNLIHMPKIPVPSGSSSSKVGFGSKGAGGGMDYVAPLLIALCEGPISGINNVWLNKNAPVTYTGNFDVAGYVTSLGTSSQTAWAYLLSNYPSQAVPYQSTAWVANPAAVLPSDSLPQLSWEINGLLPFQGFGPGQIRDASPADIVPDFLTSAQYGANFPTARIGDLTAFQNYCAAAGLFCSLVVDSQKPARDWLNDLFEIANTAPVWSDGLLKLVPYGDTNLSGNGKTYTANVTPLYNLGDNDFLKNQNAAGVDEGGDAKNADLDPVVVTRSDPATAYNRVVVECLDRSLPSGAYNPTTVIAEDQPSLEANGPIILPTLVLHAICDPSVARTVAQIRLQRELTVRNTYSFALSMKYSLLEPMDLVNLTDPGLGLSTTTVRITSVEEMDQEQGIMVTAEDWPLGTATAALYPTGTGGGTNPNTNVDPGNTAQPIIVEAPTSLATSPLDLWIGASGGANWGGCDVYISTDNTNFTKVGTIVGKAAYGSTTATLASNAAYPSIDTTHTLSVDISASGRTLVTQSNTDFTNLIPLVAIDGEWLCYRDATLTGPGAYNLTHLYRGLYQQGVNGPSHGSGVFFFFIDNAVLAIPWPQGAAGQTVYFKLPAFNIYGANIQSLASVSSYSYVIGSTPVVRQNPAPQGTVSIDADGVWSASVDGPSQAGSYRYLTSTSAYPSDSSTASTGTIVNGRTFSVTNGGTLTFGQTVFITIVPFTLYGANGSQLPSIHIRGSYLTYTATKTQTYSRNQWIEVTSPPFGIDWDANQDAMNPQINAAGQMLLALYPTVPNGVTITTVGVTCIWDSGIGTPSNVGFTVYRMPTRTSLGSAGPTQGVGWTTPTVSGLSESTSGRSYMILSEIDTTGLTSAQTAGFQEATVTYTMPDPKQTV